MKQEQKASIDLICPDLLQSPHIVDELLHLLSGTLKLDSSAQKQLIAHYASCEYCRVFLVILLTAEQKYVCADEQREAAICAILEQFVAIDHKLMALDHEHLCAYAEAIVAEGREAAASSNPIQSQHVCVCKNCCAEVDDIIKFICSPEALS